MTPKIPMPDPSGLPQANVPAPDNPLTGTPLPLTGTPLPLTGTPLPLTGTPLAGIVLSDNSLSDNPLPACEASDFFPQAYDADALNVLQRAFDSALAELQRLGYERTGGQDAEMRIALSEKIMALAAVGRFDAEDLSRRAVSSFPARS